MSRRDVGVGLMRAVASTAFAAAGAALWLTVNIAEGGQQEPRRVVDEDDDDYNPLTEPDDDGLPPAIEATFDRLGLRGSRTHERTEALYAGYKLLKALGLSDADIARFAARQAAARVDEGLERVRPTETRSFFAAAEEATLRAAEEVDVRLDLRGGLVRNMRQLVAAGRADREETLAELDRGFSEARSQMRRVLKRILADERPGDRDVTPR